MNFKIPVTILFVAISMQQCDCNPSECTLINVTCNINPSNGHRFVYDCGSVVEIYVYHNGTVLAVAEFWKQTLNLNSSEVISMDNSSVVTKRCRDLKIQCITQNGKFVTETCLEFKTSETISHTADDVTSLWYIAAPLLCLVPIIGIVYLCWKKKSKHNKESAGGDITLKTQDKTTQEFSLVDTTPQGPNGVDSSVEVVNEASEEDNTAKTMHAHSNGCKADDRTPPSLALDHNTTRNQRAQPITNGDISGLNNNKDVYHNGYNRNLRDDPGGMSTAETIHVNNGCTRGDGGSEAQPLLDRRAAVHGSDMTGEAAALVNKHDFDPDQVSRCSTAQDVDMESNQDSHKHNY